MSYQRVSVCKATYIKCFCSKLACFIESVFLTICSFSLRTAIAKTEMILFSKYPAECREKNPLQTKTYLQVLIKYLRKEISFSEWNTLKENYYAALEIHNVYYFSCFVYIFLADKTFDHLYLVWL